MVASYTPPSSATSNLLFVFSLFSLMASLFCTANLCLSVKRNNVWLRLCYICVCAIIASGVLASVLFADAYSSFALKAASGGSGDLTRVAVCAVSIFVQMCALHPICGMIIGAMEHALAGRVCSTL